MLLSDLMQLLCRKLIYFHCVRGRKACPGTEGLFSICVSCMREWVNGGYGAFPGWRKSQGRYKPTCRCLGVLTSACLHSLFWILADSSALLNGSWGIANRSLSANSALEGQARLPSAHSKKLLSFNCWYQIVDLPS